MEDLVAHVKKVDLHDALYEKYTSEPLFKNNKINAEFCPSNVLRFFKETILQ
jgi:hypothetical protein